MMRTFFLTELPNQTEVWREKSEREWKGKAPPKSTKSKKQFFVSLWLYGFA